MSLFAEPLVLLSLPIVLGLLILIYGRSRKEATRRLDALVAPKLLARLTPQRSAKKEWIKFSLFCGAIAFLFWRFRAHNGAQKSARLHPGELMF